MRRRHRLLPAIFWLAVLAFLALVVHQYVRVRTLATRQEQVIAAARFTVKAGEQTSDDLREQTASDKRTTNKTKRTTTARVKERKEIDQLLLATREELEDTGNRLALTETAVFLVAAHANDVQACVDGVAEAIGQIGQGHDEAAAASLRAAARPCDTALAAANGARFPFDFPDPYVLVAGNTYYAFSTNAGVGDIQVIRSRDLLDWEVVGNALGGLPSWAADNRTWAPSVLRRAGGYVAYYTVHDVASGRQCISSAFAGKPAGPYLDGSSAALVCQLDHGGSIDPSPFVDADGTAWLLWKSEGFGGQPATLWAQPLSADGRSLTGSPSALLQADQRWEHGVVEGPTLVAAGGRYHLFYSGADWQTRSYAVGHAVCDGPAGPCRKTGNAPVLASDERLAGPGGQEAFRSPDGTVWLAYHAYTEPHVGYPSSRTLHLARVRFDGDRAVVEPAN